NLADTIEICRVRSIPDAGRAVDGQLGSKSPVRGKTLRPDVGCWQETTEKHGGTARAQEDPALGVTGRIATASPVCPWTLERTQKEFKEEPDDRSQDAGRRIPRRRMGNVA